MMTRLSICNLMTRSVCNTVQNLFDFVSYKIQSLSGKGAVKKGSIDLHVHWAMTKRYIFFISFQNFTAYLRYSYTNLKTASITFKVFPVVG